MNERKKERKKKGRKENKFKNVSLKFSAFLIKINLFFFCTFHYFFKLHF